jgi:hypothetical protein
MGQPVLVGHGVQVGRGPPGEDALRNTERFGTEVIRGAAVPD